MVIWDLFVLFHLAKYPQVHPLCSELQGFIFLWLSSIPVCVCVWDICFLRKACTAINFPLKTALLVFQRFWTIMFLFSYFPFIKYKCISSFSLSLSYWLFSSMLVSLQVFVSFASFFFSCNQFPVLHHYGQKMLESSSSRGVWSPKGWDGVGIWRDKTRSQMEVVSWQSAADSFIYTILHKDMIIFYYSDD